jgi:uncharacterized protein involved in outer membrane biogenesis
MIAIFAALDRGALDGAVMRIASSRLHRPVRFQSLETRLLSARPQITVTGLAIGNPDWATGAPELLHADHVQARFGWSSLLRARLAPTEMTVEGARANLIRVSPERANWRSGKGGGGDPLSGATQLTIGRSRFTFDDRVRGLKLRGSVEHAAAAHPQWPLAIEAQGEIQGGEVTLAVQGGPLNGRRKAGYPIRVSLQDGKVRLEAAGTLAAPLSFKGFDLAVKAQGPNLVALEYLLNLGTPNSAPFRLEGRIERVGEVTRATNLAGVIGDSAIKGTIVSDGSGRRRLLTVDLAAEALHLRDIDAILASRPSHAVARVTPGGPSQGSGLFSDKPLDLDRFNHKDADIRLTARRFATGGLAPGNLAFEGRLRSGLFETRKFDVAFPSGRLTARYSIDLRKPDIRMTLDASLAQAQLGSLAPSMAKTLDGRARLRLRADGAGRSIQQIVSNARGQAELDLRDGVLKRSTAKFLTGALVEGALTSLFSKSATTELSCARSAFTIGGGKATVREIVLVSGSGTTTGGGAVNLSDETIDLRLYGRADGFTLFRSYRPVEVKGPLASPKVGLGPSLDKAAFEAASNAANLRC